MNDGAVGTAIVVPNEMLEASAYVASHDGAPLRGGGFADGSTGTRWDITGRAMAGELRGGRGTASPSPVLSRVLVLGRRREPPHRFYGDGK